MSRILEFKDKTEIITLDELRLTVKAVDVGGYTQIHPVDHDKVFDQVIEILKSSNLDFTVGPISVTKGKVIKRIEEELGKDVLEAHYLRKVTGTIQIHNFANEERNHMVKVEYHDRGITIAFGVNVLVCTNGMIAFTGDMVSTFGSNKMIWENIIEVIKGWIFNFENKVKQYDDIISRMKDVTVSKEQITTLIGKLLRNAVDQAYIESTTEAPFNISQVSSFTKGILIEEAKADSDNEEFILNTVWDLYQIATSIQKPGLMDMSKIIHDNHSLTKFIIQEYL